ncbi:hypothetical protein KUCAC02_037479, partial [Chaenocephalus aceratus]
PRELQGELTWSSPWSSRGAHRGAHVELTWSSPAGAHLLELTVELTWSSPGAHVELTVELTWSSPGAHLELTWSSPWSSPGAHLLELTVELTVELTWSSPGASRIRSLLPDVDAMKYKTTESHFDWEKVGFGLFSGEMCRSKWLKVSTEVRKYRTMTEVIFDATEFVRNPYKGKKLKTHPEFPKKPLTPYFRFFMEKRAKYAKIHPEMSNLDLTKILSKKYKGAAGEEEAEVHH